MAFPTRDQFLVPYSTNFNDVLTARHLDYALTEEQAREFAGVHAPYLVAVSNLEEARAQGTRSTSLTAARDMARTNLLAVGRELYSFVQANTGVSDELKIQLGVKVRSGLTTQPRPTDSPTVAIAGVKTRTVTVNIYDPTTASKRGKGDFAVAAWIYTFVGDDYPADPSGWSFQGAATKYSHNVTFPSSIAGGTQVWVMAAWINGKQQAGPPSLPVSTYLQGGGVSSQSMAQGSDGELKIAA